MKKAFDEGWGAVIAKTVSLDCSKVKRTPLHACERLSSGCSWHFDVAEMACCAVHVIRPSPFCIVQVINVTPRYAKLRCQKEVSLQA